MRYLPLAKEAGRIHVCGHRGHSVGAPENTIPALAAAAARGATVAEIDVVLTRDDHIVLLHDEILDRTTDGKGRVVALDLAEVRRLDAGSRFGPDFAGTRVPTLGEAIAVARSHGMGLLIESKERQRPSAMLELLGAVLQEEDAVDETLTLSFDHVWLHRLKHAFPAIRTELITHARHLDPAGMAERAGAASVAIEWNMFAPEDAAALHEAGIGVRVTVPRPEVFARRREYGFDDEATTIKYMAEGHIDVLAGDDVAYIRGLVAAAEAAVVPQG